MKSIVIYYSLFGHTQKVAKIIAKKLDSDLLKIKSEKAYNIATAVIEGKNDIETKHLPKLKKYNFNANEYDLIIIGSPVWWDSITPPIRTFLMENDLSEKNLKFFSTFGQSNGHIFSDAIEILNNLEDVKAFNSTKTNNNHKIKMEIDDWLG